ncbi:hypothetical protein TNIN_464681 [Trichonephila inaurata madagascariensis]|uniref:BHLH domain-containing protein n=1 Tax=Trichonephila inaurata madagascariensis TaxID=2747483 RepID=A0A8X6YM78_9ARAC|nr:hypothetical protein TNIN_464681 [Trichonephila inaurata madagascariensis]
MAFPVMETFSMGMIPQQQWFVYSGEFKVPPPPPPRKRGGSTKPRARNTKGPKSPEEVKKLASQRERNRMRLVNLAYDRLRELLPCRKPPEKKLSKIEALRFAIAYIKDLNEILSCGRQGEYQPRAPAPNYYSWLRQMKENVQQPQFQEQNVNCIVMDHADWMWEGQQRFMM